MNLSTLKLCGLTLPISNPPELQNAWTALGYLSLEAIFSPILRGIGSPKFLQLLKINFDGLKWYFEANKQSTEFLGMLSFLLNEFLEDLDSWCESMRMNQPRISLNELNELNELIELIKKEER